MIDVHKVSITSLKILNCLKLFAEVQANMITPLELYAALEMSAEGIRLDVLSVGHATENQVFETQELVVSLVMDQARKDGWFDNS